jgi:hypothetical protein
VREREGGREGREGGRRLRRFESRSFAIDHRD